LKSFSKRDLPKAGDTTRTIKFGGTAQRIQTDLDFSSLAKAAMTISGEIVMEKLLKSLMKIVIENAGAQKGYMITERRRKVLD